MKKTLLTVWIIVGIAYFGPIVYNHSLLVYWGDELEQLLPHLRQFVQWIQSGSFSLWNPSIGLGSNTWVGFFISLGSPFTWMASLFPINWLPYLFTLFDVIRFTVTAFFAYKWLSRLVNDEHSRLVGTLIITFSGYMMCWIHYGPFIDPFMGFVMVLYFAEEMLQNRKPLLFSLAVVFTILLNPYYFYMFTWFLIFYLTYRVISLKADVRFFLSQTLRFAGYYLLGVGISAIVLIPVVLILRTTPRVSSFALLDFLPTMDFRTWYSVLTSFFSPVLNDYDYNLFYSYYAIPPKLSQPYIFSFIVFVFLAFPLVRLKFPKKKGLLVFALLLYLMMLIPGFYKIFNGNTDSRWMFMIVFLNAMLASITLDHIGQLTRKDWLINALILAVIIIAFTGITLQRHWYTEANLGHLKLYLVFFIAMVALYTFAFAFLPKKTRILVLMGCLTLEGTAILYQRMTYNGSPNYVLEPYDFTTLFENPDIQRVKDMDSGFYRIDVQDGITTDPAAQDYPGFLMYMSVYNHSTQPYYDNRFMPFRKLEYAPSKDLAKTLLSSKYRISHDQTFPIGYNPLSKTLAVNSLDVGLGFATTKTMAQSTVDPLDTFIQDISMYSGIIDPESSQPFQANLPVTLGSGLINGGIDYTYREPGYLIIDYSRSNPYTNCTVDYSSNGTVLKSVSRKEYGYTAVPMDEKATRMYFYCSSMFNANDYTPVNIYEVTGSYVNQLYRSVITFDRFTDVVNQTDQVQAKIQVSENGSTVFTTIPYDSGWHVSVDGQEVPIRSVNIAFIGFELNSGSHTVEFCYLPPGYSVGLAISGLSSVIFLSLAFLEWKRKRMSA